MRHLLFIGLLGLALSTGCVTLSDTPPEPPTLSAETSTPELIQAAIEFGGPTLEAAKKILNERQAWPEVHKAVTEKIEKQLSSYKEPQVLNMVHLLQVHASSMNPKIVLALVQDQRQMVQRSGWQLAARFPSKAMGNSIETYVTDLLLHNQEQRLSVAEMADAALANQLRSLYSVLRQGLMATGEQSFARAMAAFEPEQAASDFINYLALADMEDLRQLNQKSVNFQTCMVIFNHLNRNPLVVNHPRVEVLFMYAVSRNQALAEIANVVLEKNFAYHREALASTLARLPVWVQVAYVEGSRKQTDSNVPLFLDQLKRVSAHKEVIEEIESSTN